MTPTGRIGCLILFTSPAASGQTPAPNPPGSVPAYQQGAPPPGPAPSPLRSGGLAAPAPVPRSNQELLTEQQLERAEREDAGRGLEFVWLEPEFGFAGYDLQALNDGELLDGTLITDSASGLSYGAGLGVRLVTLTAGARLRWTTLDPWDLWSLGGEVGLRIPLGQLEPYAQFGAGYAALVGFSTSAVGGEDVSPKVRGLDVRLAAGVDWYLTPVFSLGAKLVGEALLLGRGALATAPAGSVYAEDGDGAGLGYLTTAVVGLHF